MWEGGGRCVWVLRDRLRERQWEDEDRLLFAALGLVHRGPGSARSGWARRATPGLGWAGPLPPPFIQSSWTPLPGRPAGVHPGTETQRTFGGMTGRRSIFPHSRRGPFYLAFCGRLFSYFIPRTKKRGTLGLKPCPHEGRCSV